MARRRTIPHGPRSTPPNGKKDPQAVTQTQGGRSGGGNGSGNGHKPGNGSGTGSTPGDEGPEQAREQPRKLGTANQGFTCGDYGGKTPDGKMCTREAGWGIKHTATGPCADHSGAAEVKLQDTKRDFLVKYAAQPKTIRQASDEVGVSFVTIWRWRQVDPEFDLAVAELKDVVEPARVALVEESLFVRCASAKASPVETIFYLMNKAPDRWIDKRRFEHTGKGGDPIDIRSTQVITFAGQEIEVKI